jgi:two-component system chemotaxis response regulator CheB
MMRVVVAEDSPTARALLVEILLRDPMGIRVIGEAGNGLAALELTRRLRPDVVTMDLRMPILDGVEAIRRIMIEVPTPVVVVSDRDVLSVETSMNALKAGALAVIEKHPGPAADGFEESCRELLQTVRLMAGVKVIRRFPVHVPFAALPARAAGPRERFRAILIAASTGGPAALQTILGSLKPSALPVPIFVVQHIAKGFVGGLATWLNSATRLRVKVAGLDELAEPGVVYIAPDDRHLELGGTGLVHLSSGPPVGGFRPSGTTLFASAARAMGRGALGVILTGMGRDGVDGLRELKAAGGRILAQDEASSTVYGMPAAAAEAGLADEILPLEGIAERLLNLVEE